MVHKIIKLSFLIFLIAGISTSCYYDNEEELYPAETVCDTASLTYNSQISSIINSKCAIPACHGGTQSPNLSGYSMVNSNIGRIKTRAVDQMTMPPSSQIPLSDCEIKQLETWINKGNPQN